MGLCQQYAAAFPAAAQDIAQAVCQCESGGNANAHALTSLEDSRGLWQINVPAHPDWAGRNLYDPAVNVQAALAVSNGGTNWHPWTTFENGCYRQYLTGASGGSTTPLVTSAAADPGAALAGIVILGGFLLALELLD